jgi:hypothetical protein
MNTFYTVYIAQAADIIHAQIICDTIVQANQDAGNGICLRSVELIRQKIIDGDAIIAKTAQNEWMGFCYLHKWCDDFVSCCALIVHPHHRKEKIAASLKGKAVDLAGKKYPSSRLFGLTTARAVMKINSRLHYQPVTYAQVTKDQQFWNACSTCSNYEILKARGQKNCLCTAMLL